MILTSNAYDKNEWNAQLKFIKPEAQEKFRGFKCLTQIHNGKLDEKS